MQQSVIRAQELDNVKKTYDQAESARRRYPSRVVDFPPHDDVCGAVAEHVRRFFAGRTVERLTWSIGPIEDTNPHFHVLRVAPRAADGLWEYVTIGGWAATEDQDHGLEFVLSTADPDPRAVELLAMVVHYHQGGLLGLGDTCPIGEPWLPGSACDHLLVSLPYPHGPDLQVCHVGDRHVDVLWLLPITRSERDFKSVNGLEALERRFDDAALPYWDSARPSVV
jgi:suppressor of fused protein SUFU